METSVSETSQLQDIDREYRYDTCSRVERVPLNNLLVQNRTSRDHQSTKHSNPHKNISGKIEMKDWSDLGARKSKTTLTLIFL